MAKTLTPQSALKALERRFKENPRELPHHEDKLWQDIKEKLTSTRGAVETLLNLELDGTELDLVDIIGNNFVFAELLELMDLNSQGSRMSLNFDQSKMLAKAKGQGVELLSPERFEHIVNELGVAIDPFIFVFGQDYGQYNWTWLQTKEGSVKKGSAKIGSSYTEAAEQLSYSARITSHPRGLRLTRGTTRFQFTI